MTVGQAIEQADELRPNNQFTDSLKQSWLHQCDARMRTSIAVSYTHLVQVMIYDPGQLYEADRPRPDGWEATEAQAYLILRRRGFAKVRT